MEGWREPGFEDDAAFRRYWEFLEAENLHEAFVSFKAAEWIKEFRVETGGKLDIEATAEKIGVPLSMEMPLGPNGKPYLSSGVITGLGPEFGLKPIAIHVNGRYDEDEHNLTFGHEVGHLFLETVAGITQKAGHDQRIEAFCEHFGRQMILPLDQLPEIEEVTPEAVTELMARFGVRHDTIIYQLMLTGKLPRRLYFDTTIEEVPNEFYSHKVERHCLCLDCELHAHHPKITEEDYVPIYDFTMHEWSHTTSKSGCDTINWRGMNKFVLLNKAYGRWSAQDEAMVERVAKENSERRRELDKIIGAYGINSSIDYCADADDIPF